MLHTGAAPPYDGVFATVVPCNPSINIAALGAVNYAGQSVLTAVDPLLPFLPTVKVCPPHHFLLHLHIEITGNNRGMAVFHIILRGNPVVLYPLFIKEIHRIGFL